MTTEQGGFGTIPEWTQADRLRKARTTTGLSTAEFAVRVGVSQGTIQNAESGRHGVRKIVLNAWALATGVPVKWLETGAVSTENDNGPDGGGTFTVREGTLTASITPLRVAA